MTRFADLPPTDRWAALDTQLPGIIRALVGDATATATPIDPTEELSVEDIATKHGVGVRAMVTRLKELGAKPYRLGKLWHVRRASYAAALIHAENGETVTTA